MTADAPARPTCGPLAPREMSHVANADCLGIQARTSTRNATKLLKGLGYVWFFLAGLLIVVAKIAGGLDSGMP